MADKPLTEGEKQLLESREAAIEELAENFKTNVDSDRSIASHQMREVASTGKWCLSRIRAAIPGEVRALCDYMDRVNPDKHDFELGLRIVRLSLALYFLDKMDEISKKVASHPNRGQTILNLLASVRSGVERAEPAIHRGCLQSEDP